jgi:divalent metal cation (Fe/Co/Zn/Cd) transporter
VLARKVGVDYWVDMHIEVDAEITVREGHDLAHQAKDAIQHRRPEVAEVTIHVEPHEFE